MQPNDFDDGNATSGPGYAAATSNNGGFSAKITGGTRYQALAPETNGGFSKVGPWMVAWVAWIALSWVGGAGESCKLAVWIDCSDNNKK